MVKRLIWLYQEGWPLLLTINKLVMGDGEVFGELALLLDQKRSATVKAVKSTELIEIDKTGLDLIFRFCI